MKILWYTVTAGVAIFLQMTVVNWMMIKGIKPDLPLIYLVILSLREGRIVGVTSGFAIGFFQDLYAAGFLGLSCLTKSLVGFLAPYFPRGKGGVRFGTTLLICSLLHEFLYNFIYSLGSDLNLFTLIFRHAIFPSIYTCFLGMLIHQALPLRRR